MHSKHYESKKLKTTYILKRREYKVIELMQFTLDLFRLCMIHFAEFKFYTSLYILIC